MALAKPMAHALETSSPHVGRGVAVPVEGLPTGRKDSSQEANAKKVCGSPLEKLYATKNPCVWWWWWWWGMKMRRRKGNVRDAQGVSNGGEGCPPPEVPAPWGAHAANVCMLDLPYGSCDPSEDSPRIGTCVQKKKRNKETKKKNARTLGYQDRGPRGILL